MPLINKLLTSKKNIDRKNNRKLPVDLSSGIHLGHTSSFGIDQVRILLFRECEWKGRRLIFDSVTASKTHEPKGSICHEKKRTSHSRSSNGLKHEREQEICDNINLLSEMVFGTVAMTYRGTLFKIHTLDFPSCIMCTKVFPAPDDNNFKNIKETSSNNTLGISLTTNESRSSSESLKNYNWSSASSGIVSGSSMRKTSTCSSTCSGWDIDVPTIPFAAQQITQSISSEQSLPSSTSISTSSSGFSSLPSLRRRWLKAASTCLNASEINQMDEIFSFKMLKNYPNNTAPSFHNSTSSHISDYRTRQHRTKLGLTLMIKLTPEIGKKIELKLFEHAPQLEAILSRLCYVCMAFFKDKSFIERFHNASFQCTCWLLRLLVSEKTVKNASLWQEIILQKIIPTERITNTLCRKLDGMCQLLDTIDTKSTNFFLSTVLTAVLTHHLGWVDTVIFPKERGLFGNMKAKYPCNPLWIQLNDLYGTLGNPCKKVETVIAGGADKSAIINAVLTFICYYIRSTLVKRYQVFRDYSEKDIQDAVFIIEKQHKKALSTPPPPPFSISHYPPCSSSSSSSSSTPIPPTLHDNSSIPGFKRTNSLMKKNCDIFRNCNNLLKFDDKLPLKLNSCQDDWDDCGKDTANEKFTNNMLNSEENDYKSIQKKFNLTELGEKRRQMYSELATFEDEFDSVKQSVVSINTTGALDETNISLSQIQYGNHKEEIQVLFTVGDEEKSVIDHQPLLQPIKRNEYNCQCSVAFTRVPSTSAHLPEDVLRKILQRNFPESSKSIERPGTSFNKERPFGVSCPKCSGGNGANGRYSEGGSKLLLETPTNATEVLRTCGSSIIGLCGSRIARSNSLEELLEMNNFIELPMPRSANTASPSKSEDCSQNAGYIDTLLQKEISIPTCHSELSEFEYMSGIILQGLIKETRHDNRDAHHLRGTSIQSDSWLSEIHDNINILRACSFFDNSIAEEFCIVADVDKWQVGIISNTMSSKNFLLPVGMSKCVAEMLEAFAYIWTKYTSPLHCLGIIESKMRTMWLQSEVLAEMIMTMDICNVNLDTLTQTLDFDPADIPLLLAVATTHSPQISQRIGLTYI